MASNDQHCVTTIVRGSDTNKANKYPDLCKRLRRVKRPVFQKQEIKRS